MARAERHAFSPLRPSIRFEPTGQTLTLFLLLTAFSNGCTAMTGVEAVSNGVPAFKPPEAKNAAATMLMMAVLSITMFIGITLLAHAYHVTPSEQETIVSQIARGVFGGRGVPYYLVQAATMLILVLAANTAYADFPRLASILARDRYVPRQLMNQGDRLAFSNGIIGLSIFASILLVVYGGDTHSLIPLYMIGVFVSFTLSQAGMVVHWRRLRGPGWKTSAADQRLRRPGDRRRPDRRRGHEGARRRVDHPAVDPGSRVLLPCHEASLRHRGGTTVAEGLGATRLRAVRTPCSSRSAACIARWSRRSSTRRRSHPTCAPST